MNTLLKAAALCAILTASLRAADDILIADFEGADYGAWKAEGTAFGTGPAHGKLGGQMKVDRFLGKGFVNSFNDGDAATGKLTSPAFKIERPWVNFLIGGGGFAGETCMNLIVDGKVVRTATGTNTKSGGSEDLQPASWDMKELVGKSAVIEIVDQRKGGWGHINVDHIVQSDKQTAVAQPPTENSLKRDGTSPTSALRAVDTPAKPTDLPTLIAHARELRQILADDPYRPKYHFVPPEGFWNDINGMIYWKGRYHIFYLSRTVDPELWKKLEAIPGQKKEMEIWAHSSSTDLVHWTHHTPALTPNYDGSMLKGIFSGDMMDNMETPTLIYHVPGQGTCIAQAEDDMLIKWKPFPENPLIPSVGAPKEVTVFDCCGWKEGNDYFALIGNKNMRPGYAGDSSSLFTSKDLKKWDYIGPFYKSDRKWTSRFTDAACIDFFPLGNKHMIVTHVHQPSNRSQYYLGRYMPGKEFIPEAHGYFAALGGQVSAPETMSDDKGRRIFMAWNAGGGKSGAWTSMSVLPRVFSLDDRGELEQRPVEELQMLRSNHRANAPISLSPGQEHRLENVSGTCVELGLTVKPGDWQSIGVKVFQSPDGSEETVIRYDAVTKKLLVDFSKSKSGGHKVDKYSKAYLEKSGIKQESVTTQELPFELRPGEDLDLQIFLDQSVIEVFANHRVVLVQNVYPTQPTSTAISLQSEGGVAEVRRIEAWDMQWSNAF